MNQEISVSYDREIFLIQKFGGISNYFSHLIEEFILNSDLGVHSNLTFSRSSNLHLQNSLKQTLGTQLKNQKYFFQPRNWLTTGVTYGLLRSANSIYAGGGPGTSRTQLIHATYYRPQQLERRLSKRIAVTIHDFIPEKLGWSGLRNPHIGKSRLIEIADLIICVSQNTKNELEERFDTRSKNIVVIPHGSNPAVNEKNRRSEHFSILYVGHRTGYKNFQIILTALSRAKGKLPDTELVIAGPKLTPEEKQELNELVGPEAWSEVISPSDELLRNLYKTCSVHVVSSRMEGFGMTILEAMSVGSRVLASDITVFHEVGGSAVTYFDPDDADDLLEKLLLEFEIRPSAETDIKILNRSKEFTWAKSAKSHAEAYKEIIN